MAAQIREIMNQISNMDGHAKKFRTGERRAISGVNKINIIRFYKNTYLRYFLDMNMNSDNCQTHIAI
jgi:hypothetical protein